MISKDTIYNVFPEMIVGRYVSLKDLKSVIGDILLSRMPYLNGKEIKFMKKDLIKNVSKKYRRGDSIIHYNDCNLMGKGIGLEAIFLLRDDKSFLAYLIKRS